MASHGGYRAPSSPAAASGPGALSQRTDQPTVQQLTALSSGKYGETAQLQQDASGAAVSAPGPHAGNMALAQGIDSPSTFADPTQQPGTPVTDGSQFGPGRDQSALPANNPVRTEAMRLRDSGVLGLMIHVADSDDASPDYRQYVRTLIASLS